MARTATATAGRAKAGVQATLPMGSGGGTARESKNAGPYALPSRFTADPQVERGLVLLTDRDARRSVEVQAAAWAHVRDALNGLYGATTKASARSLAPTPEASPAAVESAADLTEAAAQSPVTNAAVKPRTPARSKTPAPPQTAVQPKSQPERAASQSKAAATTAGSKAAKKGSRVPANTSPAGSVAATKTKETAIPEGWQPEYRINNRGVMQFSWDPEDHVPGYSIMIDGKEIGRIKASENRKEKLLMWGHNKDDLETSRHRDMRGVMCKLEVLFKDAA